MAALSTHGIYFDTSEINLGFDNISLLNSFD